MSEAINEKISALIDGELSDAELKQLLDELRSSKSAQACWHHFYLINDALRSNLPDNVCCDLVNRVSQSLEAEPVHSVTAIPPPSARLFAFPSFIKPMTGFALAASVAALAYLGVSWNAVIENPAAPVPARVALTAPPPAAVTPAPAAATPVPAVTVAAAPGQANGETHPLDAESRLRDYLVNHHEFSGASGVQRGMMPYVRIVGYEGDAADTAAVAR